MRAWLFQDSKQKQNLGAKCPWSVGWYTTEGKKRSKKVGAKSMAEKYRRKVQAELALGLCEDKKRTKWAEFRTQFEEFVSSSSSPRTLGEYQCALNAYQRLMKPVYVDAITTSELDRFVARRRNDRQRGKREGGPTELSPASVNKDLRGLKVAFRKAHQWGLLDRIPTFSMLREPERDPEFVDDEMFAKLYSACDTMKRPAGKHYDAADWWKAIITFAYLTGWRIGEILAVRREDIDFEAGSAFIPADKTKGKRDARIELHPVVLDHLKIVVGFAPIVFSWPHHERTLWADFAKLKEAAGISFGGAFHRFRFGFANANVDRLEADVLQRLMRHQAMATTRGYINAAARMKRAGTAERLHVPDVLKVNVG